MPDQNQTNTTNATTPSPAVDDVLVSPDMPASEPDTNTEPEQKEDGNVKEVAERIKGVHNILIALSSDPSVDEIAAAIGLSLCLDRAGKRATSIYSGQTPNILEFLQPEKTFETTSDVLRDFVIALNKEKADHLRYKLDGDYVKIFITPYKTRIDEEDLEFSLGDFNIELVLALNVASGIDLDDALREHGRVMHDAVVINITNGNPGKFGDIEWSDKSKSSICEMVAGLLYELGGKEALEPNEATALLTGIVAATDHFSNNSTTADALQMGARLMESGADRELISENVDLDSQNMFFQNSTQNHVNNESDSSLEIDHDNPSTTSEEIYIDPDAPEKTVTKSTSKPVSDLEDKDSEPLPDLQKVANDLAEAETAVKPPESAAEPNDGSAPSTEVVEEAKSEKVINPSEEFISGDGFTPTSKYSQMLEEAISDPTQTMPMDTTPTYTPETPVNIPAAPTISETPANMPATPIMPEIPTNIPTTAVPEIPATPEALTNPAMSAAPQVASTPEINGVPNINYMPTPGEEILPPPPTPPVDFSQMMPST